MTVARMAICIPLFFALGLEARTQASLSVTPAEAAVGDPVTFRVIVQTDSPHDRVRLETGSGGPVWEETARRQLPPREMNGVLIREIRVTAAFFRTGKHQVGPFRLILEKDNLQVEEAATHPVAVHIVSVLDESHDDIADLKPPVPVPGSPARLLPWIAAGIILLAGVLLGWFWLRRRHRPAAPSAPPLQPLDEMERDLAILMGLGLFGRGQVKEFCLRLTPILKRFLFRNYGFNAAEMTSNETLDNLRRHEDDMRIREYFSMLLDLSDRVKFARFQPGPAGEVQLESHIREMISCFRLRNAREPKEMDVSPGK
ncbi:MAG: hypothetical protein JXA62_08125 [Candidatus Aminicenantes bacterium]|nr:hypothetical protein [Candidatus Aminicenantes bacterium]